MEIHGKDSKKTDMPLGSTLPGKERQSSFSETRLHIIFAYRLHRSHTIIQTLTQWARSSPSAQQRKPIQHTHEKAAEFSKRPDIMTTTASGSPEESKKQQVS